LDAAFETVIAVGAPGRNATLAVLESCAPAMAALTTAEPALVDEVSVAV
jgi:hypothetical protein